MWMELRWYKDIIVMIEELRQMTDDGGHRTEGG